MWTKIENESFRERNTGKWDSTAVLIYHFIFSYFHPNQTILKPKTLTNISRQSDIKKKEKKNNKRTEGYLWSDQRCRMKVERLSYCVVSDGERWKRRMKEKGTSEREGKYRESLGGIFGIFQNFWSVFLKKHLSSDSLKITLSVF